ncbi:hypothetical protein ACWFRF_10130 [Nocardia sp. NPDC055165]|uniref:hypothetical protein n=1 Tax=Nocardia sp. NPDC060220 TaxID=3347076 RepID=UPI00366558E8
MEAWYVCRAHDVQDLLMDSRIGHLDHDSARDDTRGRLQKLISSWPVFTDDPMAGSLKRALAPVFAIAAIAEITPRIEQQAARLCYDTDPADFIAGIARPAAISTLSFTFGIAYERAEYLAAASDDIMEYLMSDDRNDQVVEIAYAAALRIRAFAEDAMRAADPSPLVAALSEFASNTERCETAYAMFTQLVTGTVEPLISGLVTAALHYRSDPEADRSDRDWVELGLLYDAPFHYAPRYALDRIPELDPGIEPGDRIALVIGSAAREVHGCRISGDTASSSRYSKIAFGHGRHFCLGMQLAFAHLEAHFTAAREAGILRSIQPSNLVRKYQDGGAKYVALPVGEKSSDCDEPTI